MGNSREQMKDGTKGRVGKRGAGRRKKKEKMAVLVPRQLLSASVYVAVRDFLFYFSRGVRSMLRCRTALLHNLTLGAAH